MGRRRRTQWPDWVRRMDEDNGLSANVQGTTVRFASDAIRQAAVLRGMPLEWWTERVALHLRNLGLPTGWVREVVIRSYGRRADGSYTWEPSVSGGTIRINLNGACPDVMSATLAHEFMHGWQHVQGTLTDSPSVHRDALWAYYTDQADPNELEALIYAARFSEEDRMVLREVIWHCGGLPSDLRRYAQRRWGWLPSPQSLADAIVGRIEGKYIEGNWQDSRSNQYT